MSRNTSLFVNVNGTLSPGDEARVSALDHGFLYGDSVYETVRTYHRRPFLLGRHLDRLERSLERIFLSLPAARADFEGEVLRTIAEVPIDGDVGARLVVSRGVGPLGLDVAQCRSPSYLIYVFELTGRVPDSSESSVEGGIGIVISERRSNSPNALDPSIKSGNFLNNILAYKEAKDGSADEAILQSAEGYLAEGTTSNLFLVHDGVIETPLSHGILDGITRAVVLEEAAGAGIGTAERNLLPDALRTADEAFITSSVRGVVPVTAVDGRPLGDGRKGPVTRRVQELYEARVKAECFDV